MPPGAPPGGYGRPPAGPPPGGYPPPPPPNAAQPYGAPPGYPNAATPGQPTAGAPALLPPPRPRKSRITLRFLASSCIFTGWLTLVLSILFAIGSVIAGIGFQQKANVAATSTYFPPPSANPSAPSAPDLDGLGLPGMGSGGAGGIMGGGSPPGLGGLGGLMNFQSLMAPLSFISAVFTLISGAVTCMLFLGLGQICYVLLDLEEQSHQITQSLHMLASRGGR